MIKRNMLLMLLCLLGSNIVLAQKSLAEKQSLHINATSDKGTRLQIIKNWCSENKLLIVTGATVTAGMVMLYLRTRSIEDKISSLEDKLDQYVTSHDHDHNNTFSGSSPFFGARNTSTQQRYTPRNQTYARAVTPIIEEVEDEEIQPNMRIIRL